MFAVLCWCSLIWKSFWHTILHVLLGHSCQSILWIQLQGSWIETFLPLLCRSDEINWIYLHFKIFTMEILCFSVEQVWKLNELFCEKHLEEYHVYRKVSIDMANHKFRACHSLGFHSCGYHFIWYYFHVFFFLSFIKGQAS